MIRKSLSTLTLIAAVALVPACTGPADSGGSADSVAEPAQQPQEPAQEAEEPARAQWALSDLQVRIPSPPAQMRQACTEPKPPDLGCTTLCKPCITFHCVDGEWVESSIDWGMICDPPAPTGGPPVVCPRQPLQTHPEDPGDAVVHEGFCPAECDVCT